MAGQGMPFGRTCAAGPAASPRQSHARGCSRHPAAPPTSRRLACRMPCIGCTTMSSICCTHACRCPSGSAEATSAMPSINCAGPRQRQAGRRVVWEVHGRATMEASDGEHDSERCTSLGRGSLIIGSDKQGTATATTPHSRALPAAHRPHLGPGRTHSGPRRRCPVSAGTAASRGLGGQHSSQHMRGWLQRAGSAAAHR